MSSEMDDDNKAVAEKFYHKLLAAITARVGSTTEFSDALDKLCRRYLKRNKFRGVFARDGIPRDLRPGQTCIVNNKTLKQGGEHWVGLGMCKDGVLLQYDSFGRKNILKLPEGSYRDTERDVEQADAETNCGNRCAVFVFIFSKLGENVAYWL